MGNATATANGTATGLYKCKHLLLYIMFYLYPRYDKKIDADNNLNIKPLESNSHYINLTERE